MSFDGFWFKEYIGANWVSINNFMEVSSDSCYVDKDKIAFCIIRGGHMDRSSELIYLGCMLAPSIDDEIGVIVLRKGERAKDEWHNGTYTLQSNIKGIAEAIGVIRNIANFNAYSVASRYVLFMLIN